MASAPQAGANPRSWAVDFGVSEHDGVITLAEAVIAVANRKLYGPLDRPIVTDRPAGELMPGDLPLRFLNQAATKRVQFLDVVTNVEGPIDREAISQAMCQGTYSALPHPFGLKDALVNFPHTMQLIVIPKDGKFTVVKHVNFGKTRVC